MTINQEYCLELLKEHGIPFEEGVTYRLVEDTATLRYLVIPYLAREVRETGETLEGRISKSGILRIEP